MGSAIKMQKKIDWWAPQIGQEEYKLIKQVLDNNYPNEGEMTKLFEQKIANLVGSKHAVAVTSGTAAIFLALKAAGVGRDDEVIVPDLTFIATANAAEMCGAKPVLADVEPETLNLDPQSFEKAITGKTNAVIPVHVSGRGADMGSILSVAKDNGIAVIEDAAEAFTSSYKGRKLGTFGNAGCFSFSPNKTVTTGQGGAIVTDEDTVHGRLRELKDQGRAVRGTGGDDLHRSIGYNFKLTNLQAAVGIGQLNYLQSRVERQVRTCRLYEENLGGIDGLSLLKFREGEVPQWTDALIEKRDELCAYLESEGIGSRKYWLPIHTQAPYRLPDDGFPNSTRLSPKALWLPSAFTLSDSDVLAVCGHIKKFLGKLT